MFYSDQSTSSVFPRIQGHQSAPALVQGGDWGLRWRPTRRRGTQGRGRNRSGEHEKHKTFFLETQDLFWKRDPPSACQEIGFSVSLSRPSNTRRRNTTQNTARLDGLLRSLAKNQGKGETKHALQLV